MRRTIWKIQGFALIIAILTFYHPVAPAEAFWYGEFFDTSPGSRFLIQSEVDSLEWEIGRTYSLRINITTYLLGADVNRLSNITVESKWAAGKVEVIMAPQGPYDLLAVRRRAMMTIDFSPSKGDYGVLIGQSQHGALYYRVTLIEAFNNGTTSPWSIDWQELFKIHVEVPETVNVMLLAIVALSLGFAFVAIIGAGRRRSQ